MEVLGVDVGVSGVDVGASEVGVGGVAGISVEGGVSWEDLQAPNNKTTAIAAASEVEIKRLPIFSSYLPTPN